MRKARSGANTLECMDSPSPDDPGFALLEGACVLCDILTFYQNSTQTKRTLGQRRKGKVSRFGQIGRLSIISWLGWGGTFAVEVKGNKPIILPSKAAHQSRNRRGSGSTCDIRNKRRIDLLPYIKQISYLCSSDRCTDNWRTPKNSI